MGSLTGALNKANKVALDTNCIIYLLERNFSYFKTVMEIFNLIESGTIKGITSSLALAEILTKTIQKWAIISWSMNTKYCSGIFQTYMC